MSKETVPSEKITTSARFYRLHREEHLAKKKEEYAAKPEVIAKREERERKRAEKELEKAQKLLEKQRKIEERVKVAMATSQKKKKTVNFSDVQNIQDCEPLPAL